MIDESTVEKALDFLRDTADEYGTLVGQTIGAEHKIKIIEAIEIDKIDKGAVEIKKAKARASKEYQNAVNDYANLEAKLITLKSHRETAQAKISWAQSLAKMKGQGIIL